jgi:hypothetical protein
MLIIEDPTVTVKVRTDNVTNSSKDPCSQECDIYVCINIICDKHQFISLHDRQNDSLLENGKCRN